MILAALVVAGCDPGARVQFIEEISATDPTVSRTQAPDDEGMLSVPSSRLGEVANDVGAVRYDLNSQKRAYLLEGDLAEGVSRTMGFLHLPQLAPDATGPRTVNILPFDSRKWGSVRVYDTGLCSMAPARSPIEATEALQWRNFAHFLVDTIDASFATRGGARTTDATFDVTLNASPPVAMPRNDAFRFSVVYNHVDFDSPCTSGTVTIRASVGLTRVMGELSNVPQCPTRADTSGGRQTIAGTADFPGIVHFLEVIVEGGELFAAKRTSRSPLTGG